MRTTFSLSGTLLINGQNADTSHPVIRLFSLLIPAGILCIRNFRLAVRAQCRSQHAFWGAFPAP